MMRNKLSKLVEIVYLTLIPGSFIREHYGNRNIDFGEIAKNTSITSQIKQELRELSMPHVCYLEALRMAGYFLCVSIVDNLILT